MFALADAELSVLEGMESAIFFLEVLDSGMSSWRLQSILVLRVFLLRCVSWKKSCERCMYVPTRKKDSRDVT